MIKLPKERAWRDDYNPLSGLTLSRIVAWENEADRGAHANLQWFYHHMEKADVTVGGAMRRRLSFIEKTDWDIRLDEAADQVLAQQQADLLRFAYQQITNLRTAIAALAKGLFRGHSHLEILYEPNNPFPRELAPIDSWYWVREGLRGDWKLNVKADGGTTQGDKIARDRLIILETTAAINRAVSRHYYAKALGMADWDVALENGANQTIFVIGPPGANAEKAAEMQNIASQVATNGRGWLPDGADVKAFDLAARGKMPYLERVEYCDKQIVLAATGGMLTMLTESGSGTLAGGAHSDSLASLAQADAQIISEIFQKDFDKQLLADFFPGSPVCAYFQLDIPETTDVNSIFTNVGGLSWIGLAPDMKWLEEKTGYKLKEIPLPA